METAHAPRPLAHRWRRLLVRIALLVAALVLFRVLWHLAMRDDAHGLVRGEAVAELLARRDGLARRMEGAPAAALGSQFDGEWAIVTLSMLARHLEEAPDALMETYPGERYVADNAVALAALALADVGRGDAHRALIDRTLARWRSTLVDPATGIFVFGPDDRAARASGAAWTALYLGYVDEAVTREQTDALFAHFGSRLGLYEYADGRGMGDVDSGPLVFGLSPSATGFGIALARRAGDERRLGDWLSVAEWVGLTLRWDGERRYAFAPMVGEAIVLAAKSARAWDSRFLP